MDDFLTSEALAISPDLLSIRLNTLNELSGGKSNIVITNLMGLLRYLPSKKLWKDSIISLKKGDSVNKDELVSKLMSLGYNPETSGNTYKLYVNGTTYLGDHVALANQKYISRAGNTVSWNSSNTGAMLSLGIFLKH